MPQVPIRLITPDDVRASVKRAKGSLRLFAEEIVWQIEMEGWRTLGYSSWDAMREAEYGANAFMVPKKDRPELVDRMRKAGLTQQVIAKTAGVSVGTVNSDLTFSSENDDPSRPFECGQPKCWHEPACARVAPTRNTTPSEPKPPRRRPLPDGYDDAVWKVGKLVTSLSNLHKDDRFKGNREKVKQRNGPELARAVNELVDLLGDLGIDRHKYGGTGRD